MVNNGANGTYGDVGQVVPTYSGGVDPKFKTLSPEQLQVLTTQLERINELNGQYLPSSLKRELATGDPNVLLPKGTLIHGTSYSPDGIRGLASTGIVSGELIGKVEDGETNYCVHFWRMEREMTIGQYCELISGAEPNTGDEIRRRPEGNWIPNQYLTSNRIALVVDSEIPEIRPLLEYDVYRDSAPPIAGTIVSHLPLDKGSPESERVSAVIGGIPASAIAGVVVSRGIENNPEILADINDAFKGKVPILTIDGTDLSRSINNSLPQISD